MPLNEADTCRVYVTSRIREAGWEQHPHSITEQKTFTDGRVEVRGNVVRRREQKRADYLLRYTRDFPIAVVEAKPVSDSPGKGMQQAKEYAEILGLKFAYATNGHQIMEFDYLTGQESELTAYPSPAELFSRLKANQGIEDEIANKLLTDRNRTLAIKRLEKIKVPFPPLISNCGLTAYRPKLRPFSKHMPTTRSSLMLYFLLY